MKLVHLSDTHLGYAGSGIQRFVENPANLGSRIRQREADLMLGLSRAVDTIIENVQPDVVLHTGDLFDNAKPTPQTIDFAMNQIKRLTEAGIPVVILEGLHSYPRDYSRGHVLKLLSHLPNVTVFCADEGQIRVGDILIHAYPYRAIAQGKIPHQKPIDNYIFNILAVYAVADGLHYFKGYRPAADLLIREYAPWYDYVALGHYHRFAQVPSTDSAFYSGATAMVVWSDLYPGYKFGFNVIELKKPASMVERQTIDTRPMHIYGLDDAQGLSADEVFTYLNRQITEEIPDNAYCQVNIDGMDPLARKQFDQRIAEELFERAAGVLFKIQARSVKWDAVHVGLTEGTDPNTRFKQLAQTADGEPEFKKEVLELGEKILKEAQLKIEEDENENSKREEETGE